MKKYFITILAMMISGAVFAAETNPVANIKVSPDWGKAQCAEEPGKGVVIVWNGAVDRRASPAVGVLKTKKEEADVKLADSIDSVVGEAVKNVLKNCGFTIEMKKDAEGVKAEAEVVDFFAGAKKGFLTGETDAKGSLVLHFENGGRTYDFNLGAAKSDKRLRKKDIKQLEGVLTGLLEEMVTQIGDSPALFTEVKKLAGK